MILVVAQGRHKPYNGYQRQSLCLVGMLAVAALAAALAACSRATSEQPPTLVPVRITEVQAIDTGTTNIYSANIQPYQQVDLSFKSNGYLASIRQVRDAQGHIRNIDQG